MTKTNSKKNLSIIGNNTLISICGHENVPAKIDTGADSSSVWASDIEITAQGELSFVLFAPGYPLYTGERILATEYNVIQVRSSNGASAIRYQTPLSITIRGKRLRVRFTLSNRSQNRFPVLIGRKTLQNKFLVDVSQIKVPRPATFNNASLEAELRADPQKFHKKYMEN